MNVPSVTVLSGINNTIALSEGSHSSPTCVSDKTSTKLRVGVKHWWTIIERAKSKYEEKNLSQYHLVHYKSVPVSLSSL